MGMCCHSGSENHSSTPFVNFFSHQPLSSAPGGDDMSSVRWDKNKSSFNIPLFHNLTLVERRDAHRARRGDWEGGKHLSAQERGAHEGIVMRKIKCPNKNTKCIATMYSNGHCPKWEGEKYTNVKIWKIESIASSTTLLTYSIPENCNSALGDRNPLTASGVSNKISAFVAGKIMQTVQTSNIGANASST